MTRYLYIDTECSREEVENLDEWPKIGERVSSLFQVDDVYVIVCLDPSPYDLDGDLITGGRIWVRRVV